MINLKNLRDKKIGVLGLEKTGLSVVKAVQEVGGLLICWDDDKGKRDNLEKNGVTVGDLNDKNLIKVYCYPFDQKKFPIKCFSEFVKIASQYYCLICPRYLKVRNM